MLYRLSYASPVKFDILSQTVAKLLGNETAPFWPPRLRRERQETRQRTRHPPRRGSLVHTGSLEFYRKRGEKETILLLRYRTAILTALGAGVVLLAVVGWL